MVSLGHYENRILYFPDSKVHGANMGPIWGRQDPGGPHVGPMNFAIWVGAWQYEKYMMLDLQLWHTILVKK